MANNIVKDSGLAIFVKEISVAEATKANDLVRLGSVAGLAGDAPRKGQDGKFYVSVDTAALIRLDAVTGAYTDKAPVYMTSAGAVAAASAAGAVVIGYADRPKAAAAGKLFVQLTPAALVAAS